MEMDDRQSEIFKLDKIDRKVLFWMMDNTPQTIRSWLEYTANEYKRIKKIEIDVQRFQLEIDTEINNDVRKLD